MLVFLPDAAHMRNDWCITSCDYVCYEIDFFFHISIAILFNAKENVIACLPLCIARFHDDKLKTVGYFEIKKEKHTRFMITKNAVLKSSVIAQS